MLMTVLLTVVLLSSSLLVSWSWSLFSASAMAFALTAKSVELKPCTKLAKKGIKKENREIHTL